MLGPVKPLAITIGEPAGIGPELLVSVIRQNLSVPLVYVGDPDLLLALAPDLTLVPFDKESKQFKAFTEQTSLWKSTSSLPNSSPSKLSSSNSRPSNSSLSNSPLPNHLPFIPVRLQVPVIPGQVNPINSGFVLECLKTATEGALAGHFGGIVTGPVYKAAINAAGIPFTGQTEFIADICHSSTAPIMMLCYEKLRVALVTTHLALAAVPEAITRARLQHCIATVHHDLISRFGCATPKIAVLGLNPHAGENGYLGREEIEIITPVIQACQQRGLAVSGPYPADTVFAPKHRCQFDAIIAMYHDQGLAAIKALGFHSTVNVTLGLPVIRTSVDHGTALDLVGKGIADAGSLRAAIKLAVDMTMINHDDDHMMTRLT